MKKRVLPVLIAGLFSVFLCGCDEDLDARSLIGMSRENVLRLAFEKYPKTVNGELNIGVWEVEKKTGRSHIRFFYYKSCGEARKDDRLMNSKFWEIGEKRIFTFSIYRREEHLLLTFENGKVVKVEKTYWNKT